MPSVSLQERSALYGLATPGRFGMRTAEPGLVIEECTGLAFATVLARRAQTGALATAVAARYGVTLPTEPCRVTGGAVTFAGIGPGQWIASAGGVPDFVARLRSDLGILAAVVDQSDSRLVVRLSGPRARDVLAKGVPVDLHPRAFKTGDVATTVVAHVGVQIDMLDDTPAFQLAAPRSMAGSFWSWLTASAAEFGYEVVTR
jgi:heterotetrameric sarcosine oxidase gamma subunit